MDLDARIFSELDDANDRVAAIARSVEQLQRRQAQQKRERFAQQCQAVATGVRALAAEVLAMKPQIVALKSDMDALVAKRQMQARGGYARQRQTRTAQYGRASQVMTASGLATLDERLGQAGVGGWQSMAIKTMLSTEPTDGLQASSMEEELRHLGLTAEQRAMVLYGTAPAEAPQAPAPKWHLNCWGDFVSLQDGVAPGPEPGDLSNKASLGRMPRG